jgi:ParB-like chromosome segregation protein Spo0J
MSELQQVRISSIDPNPMRQLEKYPYVERKIEALLRSIADVGLWEGVIGRKAGNRIQIAFGHHRVEAARRSKDIGNDGSIPIIVRELDDKKMLRITIDFWRIHAARTIRGTISEGGARDLWPRRCTTRTA